MGGNVFVLNRTLIMMLPIIIITMIKLVQCEWQTNTHKYSLNLLYNAN